MTVHFGKRVAGAEAHAAAVAKNKAGAEVFGKRVRGAIAVANPENSAKANSEFGFRTTTNAKMTDQKGKAGTVSVDDLENILTENPTFFDSLYEQELALPQGPRKDALEIFAVVEMGIKGAGRRAVLDEINALLGKTEAVIEARSATLNDKIEKYGEQKERMEENKLLQDAPRVKALAERDENLSKVEKSSRASTRAQAAHDPSQSNTSSGTSSGETPKAHTDKAEDDVKPETQSRAPRSSQKKTAARK